MRLPEEFKNKMKRLLGDEYEEYEKSLQQPMYSCLRVNTLKISVEDFLAISPFELTPVPWTENGFYYDASVDTPSKHPFYYAGLYYLQEPSASLPAATLNIEEGDKVLDICAAPGGKSTELACKLRGTGILVSNDISASRIKALQKNIELFGITNAVIMCERPDKLSEVFTGYFDKILVDAPCSGEGMFRKSSSMITAWEQNGNMMFVDIQKSILKEVVKMLKPGGTILYSTCTFDPREDEEQVMYLMRLDPSLRIVPIRNYEGFVPGNPDWTDSPEKDESLTGTMHLFPHKVKGEGHYVSMLESESVGDNNSIAGRYNYKPYSKGKGIPEIDEFLSHISNEAECSDRTRLEFKNNKLYLVPVDSPELSGMRIMRRGVYLGELKTKRFEPSQSFAMILKKSDFDNVLNFRADSILVNKYLHGESIYLGDYDLKEMIIEDDKSDTEEISDGWILVCVEGYPLGFGKMIKGTLKNKYLPGWRMN